MDVASCQLVSEEGLQAVKAGCLGLQHTVIANRQLFSEEGLQALGAGCPGLQHMDVTELFQDVNGDGKVQHEKLTSLLSEARDE